MLCSLAYGSRVLFDLRQIWSLLLGSICPVDRIPTLCRPSSLIQVFVAHMIMIKFELKGRLLKESMIEIYLGPVLVRMSEHFIGPSNNSARCLKPTRTELLIRTLHWILCSYRYDFRSLISMRVRGLGLWKPIHMAWYTVFFTRTTAILL